MRGTQGTQDGLPNDSNTNHTDDDVPPKPTAPAGRRPSPSIRELVDRELRGALVLAADGLPRRPSEPFNHLARGHTRPAGKLPERLQEYAADPDASLERIEGALIDAVRRALRHVFADRRTA